MTTNLKVKIYYITYMYICIYVYIYICLHIYIYVVVCGEIKLNNNNLMRRRSLFVFIIINISHYYFLFVNKSEKRVDYHKKLFNINVLNEEEKSFVVDPNDVQCIFEFLERKYEFINKAASTARKVTLSLSLTHPYLSLSFTHLFHLNLSTSLSSSLFISLFLSLGISYISS